MNEAIITTSWDDGHPLDIKLSKLLKKYGIPATFYISISNKINICMKPEQIREVGKNFDIGAHTLTHKKLTRLSSGKKWEEILEGKKILEKITGKRVMIFCYPLGGANGEIISIVKKSGFIGARSVDRFSRRINNRYKMKTTVHAATHKKVAYIFHFLKQLILTRDLKFSYFLIKNVFFNKTWDELAIITLKFVLKRGGVWHLWGHSWEIDKFNGWRKLENVLKKVKKMTDKKNVKFMNNSQLISNFLTSKNKN